MTQKEKIRESFIFAQRVKSLAERLEYDAKDYDCKWPLGIAEQLKSACESIIKKLK